MKREIKFSKVYYGSFFMWHIDYCKEIWNKDGKNIFSTKKELINYYKVSDVKKIGKSFAVGNNTGYYDIPLYSGIATL